MAAACGVCKKRVVVVFVVTVVACVLFIWVHLPAEANALSATLLVQQRAALPELVTVARLAERELARGSQPQAGPKDDGANFEAVRISLPLAPPIIDHDPAKGRGEGAKNIVGLRFLGKRGEKRCVVYGMGIAWESKFEQRMARQGCETHAFDCTVDPASPVVVDKGFTFHNWCIGGEGSKFNERNMFLKGARADELKFRTLSETMRLLQHDHVDILKFDIEGFEWQLFSTDILKSTKHPRQLAFELHTEGSAPQAVPPHLVKGKGFVAVNRLFLDLHKLGYRIVSKEKNMVDSKCAEFVLVNINDSGN